MQSMAWLKLKLLKNCGKLVKFAQTMKLTLIFRIFGSNFFSLAECPGLLILSLRAIFIFAPKSKLEPFRPKPVALFPVTLVKLPLKCEKNLYI